MYNASLDFLLGILARDLPAQARNIIPERVVLGQANHVRRTETVFPVPEYVCRSPRMAQHIMPDFRYVVSGEMALNWDTRFYRLQAGDYCFIPRMLHHFGCQTQPRQPYGILIFKMYFTNRLWIIHNGYSPESGDRVYHIIQMSVPAKLLAFFNGIFDGSNDPCRGFPEIKEHIIELYGVVGRSIADDAYYVYQDEGDKTWKQKALRKIIPYIHEHIDEKLSLESLARQINVSKEYFATIFKKEFGESAIEYIITRKLNKAVDMLRESDSYVSEIADSLNFKDVYYFSKLFKKYFGISPTVFRNQYL